jgi:acyl carrier protein
MSVEAKLKSAMGAVLGIDPATIDERTSTDTVEGWDSLKHMQLIIAIEESCGVVLPDEEVTTLTSYKLLKLVVEEQLAKR